MMAAMVGLVGVLLGIAGTLVATRMTNDSNERLAKQARREERDAAVRELAAEAYVAAVDGIQWLSIMHVEDSVDPRFAETYAPKTAAAVTNLRQARTAITKAAALGGTGELSRVAAETSVALNILDDAWHGAQEYRSKLVSTPESSKSTRQFFKRVFDRHYERLQHARTALVGFDGSDQLHEEIDRGSVLEASLLFRVRESMASLSMDQLKG